MNARREHNLCHSDNGRTLSDVIDECSIPQFSGTECTTIQNMLMLSMGESLALAASSLVGSTPAR